MLPPVCGRAKPLFFLFTAERAENAENFNPHGFFHSQPFLAIPRTCLLQKIR
jgi:hypothetical protein